MAKIDIVHVPYKGGDSGIVDLLTGRVQLYFGGPMQMLPYVKQGKLKILAIASGKRSKDLPEVPTIGETVPGYAISSWFGILAPAGLPKDAYDKLSTEVVRAVQSPEMQARLVADGNEPIGSTPPQFAAFIKAENAKASQLVREMNLKLD
jgi:tripartite-type tricarboxylate transporter receptor subunit TctC